MINEFGRLNNRKLEAREEIAEARKRQEELDDAEEGVMLADSDEGTIKCVAALSAQIMGRASASATGCAWHPCRHPA